MIELEVKILNMDLDLLEEKIKAMGARFICEEKQINTIFDSEDLYIEENLNSYLRIRETEYLGREDRHITLTLKTSLKDGVLRKNIEQDVNLIGLSDKENMIEILDLLGYKVVNIGHKHRKSYAYNDIRFDLDRWDENTYPHPYMEIEVKDSGNLEEVLEKLDIPRENVSTKSIRELKKEIK